MKHTHRFSVSAVALAAVALAGCNYFSAKEEISSAYGTEKVENDQFIVSFSEGGELVAVNSVQVESEMDGSSTIVSIVEEGTYVNGPRQVQAEAGDTPATLAARNKVTESDLVRVNPNLEQAIANNETINIPGDLLVELDPGTLKDRILSQEISVRTAKNSVTKSENDLEIQKLKNEQNIDDARIALNFARLDLKKFKDSDAQLTRDDYAGQLANLSNQVSISEAKLKWLKELEERKFLSKMSLREEEQKVAEYRHKIKMLAGESDAYEKFVYPKSEQDYNSKIKQAELGLTTVEQTATNNMITATEEVDTQKQKHTLEEEKLAEVKNQLTTSRIFAPASGLVVYHVGESSRYGGSSGIIEKGTTLRKGQDIIHLPDLSKMKVALKIHESRINQVKPGLQVQIRIDTIAERTFRGEITYVAPVAAAAERWGSDKKVFKCEVSIADKLPSYIRPGASATCRIFVANLPKVRTVDGKKVKTLRVPIQSVVTTAEGRRVCFKMNKKNQPMPVRVETGYYDQTHIQITSGLALGEVILKAPLLHAKELNVGGGLFGYKQINAEDFFEDLPETIQPAKPVEPVGPNPTAAQKAPPTQGGQGKGRPGGSSGRSSEPPAELSLTAEQKTQWAAAAKKMAEKMTAMRSSGDWSGAGALRTDFQADLAKFLSKEQLAKYAEMRGNRSSKGGGGGGRPGGGGGGGSLMDLDTDTDGNVSEVEYAKMPERIRQIMGEFSALDADGDGGINKEEADAARRRMMQRFQGGGSGR
ncbi:MAG: efflux RND transporter periplasmic adaptor subunit [Verrucomicrobia subdivision 3 bacterium]|nr:efflux RND transporter periplasmic adaptor subunit [Limisphaerales bacterium]